MQAYMSTQTPCPWIPPGDNDAVGCHAPSCDLDSQGSNLNSLISSALKRQLFAY